MGDDGKWGTEMGDVYDFMLFFENFNFLQKIIDVLFLHFLHVEFVKSPIPTLKLTQKGVDKIY